MSIPKVVKSQLLTPASKANIPVSSPEIIALRQEKATLEAEKTELEKTLALLAARKVQAEHDREVAIKAKQSATPSPKDKTGISIIRSGLTNADIVEGGLLMLLNGERKRRGLEPFADYSAYLAQYTDTPDKPDATKISIAPTTGTDPVTPLDKLVELSMDYAGRPLKASGDVYHIINGGYYICWNKSRCYIQRTEKPEVNILILGERLYGDSSVMQIIPDKSFRDLTRAEVDNIVKGKPSYSDLFKVYCKFCNPQNVYFDTKNALPVW